MVDDMGFSDLGCYGGEIDTPNIDRLATAGVQFTQFYNAGRCCPTRASLLTGLYAHKTGLGYMTGQDYGKPGYRADMNRKCVTIAEVLGQQGYSTYMVGKWHVCHDFSEDGPRHNWPLQRGFEKFYGTLIAAGSLWNPLTLTEGNLVAKPTKDFYYTEAITEKAIQYIREAPPEKPFFLYVAHPAPHWPLHARKEVIEKYRGRFSSGWDQLREQRHQRLVRLGIASPRWKLSPRGDGIPAWSDTENRKWEQRRMEAYAAMIDHVDQSVGRLVRTLKKLGKLDDTLILFLSDNGGESLEHPNGEIGTTGKPWAIMRYVPLFTHDGKPVVAGDIPGVDPGPANTYAGYGVKWANVSNTPFRFYKKYVHEGGIATPLIAHWPSGIMARKKMQRAVGHVIDIMPTCLDAAGASYPESFRGKQLNALDGKSLIPVLKSGKSKTRTLFWEHEGNRAVRDANWKIVSRYPRDWELYDMKDDRTENTDLAKQRPEIVVRLKKKYERWAAASDVADWAKMKINVIASKKSPLRRTDAEMVEYERTMRNLNLPPFVEKPHRKEK